MYEDKSTITQLEFLEQYGQIIYENGGMILFRDLSDSNIRGGLFVQTQRKKERKEEKKKVKLPKLGVNFSFSLFDLHSSFLPVAYNPRRQNQDCSYVLTAFFIFFFLEV